MTTGCYKTSLLLFAYARGAGTLLTVKCPAPGTHRETNARGFPVGGMLAVAIDSQNKDVYALVNVTPPHPTPIKHRCGISRDLSIEQAPGGAGLANFSFNLL